MAKIVIMGDPIPLARARHSGRRVWDSQKEQKFLYGMDIRKQHITKHGDFMFAGRPIHLDVIFFMAIPKTSAKRAAELENTWHYTKTDADNMEKWVNDVATGIMLENDCIVASTRHMKIYSRTPRTEFHFTPLTKDHLPYVHYLIAQIDTGFIL